MKVSIVAAYNNKLELTKEFLDNLQDKTKYFIGDTYMILVNGGNPIDIQHPFISKLIRLNTNEGFTKVLNHGLRAVPEDSDYVFFVGNDSFPVDTDWLDSLILLQKETDAWMVCPANDNPGMHVYTHLYHTEREFYYEVDFFPSIAWLMPYDKFKLTGLLDEGYLGTGMYSDNDYCAMIKSLGGTIIVSKNILLKHLLSAEGREIGSQGRDMSQGLELYIKKWH
jgi:GT2 family glycosyltransferase